MAKLYTPRFRVSFPNVFEAKAIGNSKPKFSVTMLFDKSEIAKDPSETAKFKAIKEAITAAANEKWGEVPDNLQHPIRKGEDKAEYSGYGEGIVFVNCSSTSRPGVVDESVKPIMDQGDFYGGCYAQAVVNVYAWEYMGKKGVSVGLQNIQKLGDGETFGGKSKAEDDFAAIKPAEASASTDDDLFGE